MRDEKERLGRESRRVSKESFREGDRDEGEGEGVKGAALRAGLGVLDKGGVGRPVDEGSGQRGGGGLLRSSTLMALVREAGVAPGFCSALL